jgi:hypothetical protein
MGNGGREGEYTTENVVSNLAYAWNIMRLLAIFCLLSPTICVLILKSPILNFRNLPSKFLHTLSLASTPFLYPAVGFPHNMSAVWNFHFYI